ncbi:MAG: NAD(P)H-binding protein [Chitinophagaceae bacterium]
MKATLIGASGLIGGLVLERLLKDPFFDSVRILTRKPFAMEHPKLEKIQMDFRDMKTFRTVTEDIPIIFCAIGTTMEKVGGDKEAYRKVDFDIAVDAAHLGRQGGCKRFILVSSVGANQKKRNFYQKLKGETEEGVRRTAIESIHIMRPSLLLGERTEERIREQRAQKIIPALSFLLPGKYKPIRADTVAAAMVAASKLGNEGLHIHHYRDMKRLAKSDSLPVS